METPGRARGSTARIVAPPVGHRKRRPTGAPPPLPKTIGLTGKLWLAALLLIVVSGTIWLHFTTGPLDRVDAVFIRFVTSARGGGHARAPGPVVRLPLPPAGMW